MPQINLYVDVTAGNLVTGPLNPTTVSPPAFIQGDTLSLVLQFLIQTPNFPGSPGNAPYTIMNLGGLTIEMAIGDRIGNTTNYYATQFAWTISSDSLSASAQFSLNTTPVTTLLGATSSQQTNWEIKYLSGGLPTTVLEKQINLLAAVIKPGGALVVPPGLTPLSAEYANATFLTRTVQGAIQLVSADGTKKCVLYMGNDGTFHADPSQ